MRASPPRTIFPLKSLSWHVSCSDRGQAPSGTLLLRCSSMAAATGPLMLQALRSLQRRDPGAPEEPPRWVKVYFVVAPLVTVAVLALWFWLEDRAGLADVERARRRSVAEQVCREQAIVAASGVPLSEDPGLLRNDLRFREILLHDVFTDCLRGQGL